MNQIFWVAIYVWIKFEISIFSYFNRLFACKFYCYFMRSKQILVSHLLAVLLIILILSRRVFKTLMQTNVKYLVIFFKGIFSNRHCSSYSVNTCAYLVKIILQFSGVIVGRLLRRSSLWLL